MRWGESMKVKKMKKQIKILQHDVDFLTKQVALLYEDIAKHQCHCENYKPKTVQFKRFVPLPEIYSQHEDMYEALKGEQHERKTKS